MERKLSLPQYLEEKGIPSDLIQTIESVFTLRSYKKGCNILSMGENTKVLCLLLQGIVRGVYIDDEGVEVTKCFSQEGEWCCFYNILSDSPSEFWIEALEDCQVAEIAVERLRDLIKQYQQFQNLFDELYKNAFMLIDEKGVSFQRMHAKERYLHFINKNANIEERVKQEYIASYIGITPSSLSRIKREL